MKTTIAKFAALMWALLMTVAFTACDDDNTSDMRLDGDCWLTEIKIDDYAGTIDNNNMTVTVNVPETYDVTAMKVTSLGLSEGAVASLSVDQVVDFSFPQTVKVTNGNAYLDYVVTVKRDEARITSFKLNDTYTGLINDENHTIKVIVPTTVDVTSLVPTIETTPGATVTPAAGQAIDFSSPVEFTVTYQTATTVYTVTVTQSDAPEAAYVGLAATIDGLNPEEKAAATWMLNNVAGAQYISFADIANGTADLSECKVIWWHLHIDGGIDNMDKFDAAAPAALDAVPALTDYYNRGGSFLFTRYATYYPVKLGATKDGSNPNNCWGQAEESGEITTGPWNFYVDGQEDHPLYNGVVQTADGRSYVNTCDAGYRITNSTAQWHIGTDWGGYATIDAWRSQHGATDLGWGGDGSVVVWEYPANAAGARILCIGSGAYDWYSYGVDTSNDQYHGNVSKMTMNAINYLIGQ